LNTIFEGIEVENITKRFADNARVHRRRIIIVWHWLAGKLKPSIDWLDIGRAKGKGSVAYNFIIPKIGNINMLLDPFRGFFHNTGLETNYDKHTISIAFELDDANDKFTQNQLDLAKKLYYALDKVFHIIKDKNHAELNDYKIDLSLEMVKQLREYLNLVA